MGGSSSSNGRKYLGGDASHEDAVRPSDGYICVSPPRPLAPSVERLRKEQTAPQTHIYCSSARLCAWPPLTAKELGEWSFIIGKKEQDVWNGMARYSVCQEPKLLPMCAVTPLENEGTITC